ncbi:H(+)/Cl(-) exchange transporter ClcA [Methylolobus aquaticus]|nr:H(+)/Cl(-) exchange transporter ClcA [Methylolobus aquaticus]
MRPTDEHRTPTALQQQRRRYSAADLQRRRFMPRAVWVGLCAGVVAVAFHLALDFAESAREAFSAAAKAYGPAGLLAIGALTLIAVVAAVWLVRRFSPEAAGSGIPHLKAVLQGDRELRAFPLLVVKFVSGVIGIGAGLALGREGPTVQMGAAVGKGLTPLSAADDDERRLFIAAGAAAGLSAAFNAPLSGLVFVLEELQGRTASSGFFVAAIACLTADMVCRVTLGQFPVFRLPLMATPALSLLPLFLLLGVLCGVLGVLFNQCLLYSSRVLGGRSRPAVTFLWWMVWAAVTAYVGWQAPEVLGSGQRFVGVVLDGNTLALGAIPAYFLLRFALTIGSYGTGVAGGIFSPILVLGALSGLGLGDAANIWFTGADADPRVFAVVGMAAYFTGVVRAPLTGIVLIIEMTGNYGLVLPLFAACFAALMTADALHDLPIYEALLERDLAQTVRRRPGRRASK